MTTHFYPLSDDEVSDQAPCGTQLGDSSELTFNWQYVDCRRCLKHKGRITAAHRAQAQGGDA